jgi:hypothetical protein
MFHHHESITNADFIFAFATVLIFVGGLAGFFYLMSRH